jgi:hypothetical protein
LETILGWILDGYLPHGYTCQTIITIKLFLVELSLKLSTHLQQMKTVCLQRKATGWIGLDVIVNK